MMSSSVDMKMSGPQAAGSDRGERPLVLHVTNIPTPYRLPYFRALNDLLGASGIDLHIFFLGRGKRRREWMIGEDELHGFDHTLNSSDDIYQDLVAMIAARRPAVVVLAWAMDILALRLLLHCRSRRIRTILFTGETIGTAEGRSHAWLRSLVRRPFFRLADGFLTYGTRSAEYLRARGVPERRITVGINVVDTEFFRGKVDELRASGEGERARSDFRDRSGNHFSTHLLIVSYMIPGKGISSTLRALAKLGRSDIALHLVGSGPRDEAHRTLVSRLGLEDLVFFHGYRQTREMPLYYAFADIALFPSSVDVFGLVMVEAAAAGLPLIASTYSGGTIDVVEDGVTGIVIDPRNAEEYAAAIARLADNPELRWRMGSAAREHAMRNLTPERSAERYLDAVTRLVPFRRTKV